LDAFSCNNARIFPGDGRVLLDRVTSQSIDTLVLLFPDPWPKAKHEKRQMFSPYFMDHLKRILKPGALFRFASDAAAYVDKVTKILDKEPSFSCAHRWKSPNRPNLQDWPYTRYEKKALSAGRTCEYFHYLFNPIA
jgi:tRNA (guanine-N7-)-methyltransferase